MRHTAQCNKNRRMIYCIWHIGKSKNLMHCHTNTENIKTKFISDKNLGTTTTHLFYVRRNIKEDNPCNSCASIKWNCVFHIFLFCVYELTFCSYMCVCVCVNAYLLHHMLHPIYCGRVCVCLCKMNALQTWVFGTTTTQCNSLLPPYNTITFLPFHFTLPIFNAVIYVTLTHIYTRWTQNCQCVQNILHVRSHSRVNRIDQRCPYEMATMYMVRQPPPTFTPFSMYPPSHIHA